MDRDGFGYRSFKYLDTPLRWVHEVRRTLLEEGHPGLAEDVAVPSFEVEAYWNQFAQKRITVDWLRTLEEPEGQVMARALRRSGASDYFGESMGTGRIFSRTLAAEFGR